MSNCGNALFVCILQHLADPSNRCDSIQNSPTNPKGGLEIYMVSIKPKINWQRDGDIQIL